MRNPSKETKGVAPDGPSKEVSESSDHSRLYLVRDLAARAPRRSKKQLIMPESEPVGSQPVTDIWYHKSEQMSDGDEPVWVRIAAWAMVFETALAIIAAACWKLWALLR